MMTKFSQRSFEKELMDDLECSGEELAQTLKELKTINKLLGGNQVTTGGLKQIFNAHPQEEYSISDIGCGGGDMMRVMHDWARNVQKKVNFEGIDANPNIIELAKTRLSDLDNVTLTVQNIFSSEFLVSKVDVCTCTLFTHHFTDSELIQLLKGLKLKSNLGIVINDLHRNPIAYHSIKILTKLFSKSPMVQNDGPLSVLRAFSKADWERILDEAGIKDFQLTWHWAFRWQVLIIV
jgi:2-polyprenyl-3-methyl-5-hydroxy-6-metoxy-1,4-benzoquinol methylase